MSLFHIFYITKHQFISSLPNPAFLYLFLFFTKVHAMDSSTPLLLSSSDKSKISQREMKDRELAIEAFKSVGFIIGPLNS